jgi:hypothetical protein
MIYLCVYKSISKEILNILLIIDIKNENIIIAFYCYKNNTSQKKITRYRNLLLLIKIVNYLLLISISEMLVTDLLLQKFIHLYSNQNELAD